MPAMPTTTVQKMIGAIIILISLMKPSPSGFISVAQRRVEVAEQNADDHGRDDLGVKRPVKGQLARRSRRRGDGSHACLLDELNYFKAVIPSRHCGNPQFARRRTPCVVFPGRAQLPRIRIVHIRSPRGQGGANLRELFSSRFSHFARSITHATSIHPQGAHRRRRTGQPFRRCPPIAADTIKVGILHSLSGTMAISETVLKDTVLMAIDEINAKGGVLGKKLEPVVVDPASNWPLFAEKTKQLLDAGQGRRDLRLLDLGVAQVGAAGGRGTQRPAVLPGAVRRRRAVQERVLHRCRAQPAGDSRRSTT